MKIAVQTIEGDSAGEIELTDAIFGVPSARTSCSAASSGSWRAAAGHAQDQEPRRGRRPRPRRCTPRRAPAAPVTARGGAAVPRRRQGLRPGRAQPRVRPAEEGPRAGAALRAVVQGGRRQADRARRGRARRAQDRSSRAISASSAGVGAGDRRRRGRHQLRPRRAQHRPRRRAAAAGCQRLRHPAPRHAGADQGRREAARGAPQ